MLASFCASRLDATRRMSAMELVCAAQLQQRLRPSSDSVAAPSQCSAAQLRRNAALRAASAPSQQHQLRRGSRTRRAALNSDKGYSVGQKYAGYVEHTKLMLQAADGAEAAALRRLELIGPTDDLLSIKGSWPAAPTCRR